MNEALAPQQATGDAVASESEPATERRSGAPERSNGPNALISLLHRAAGETPGIDVIYDALALVGDHFHLDDALVVVNNQALGPQAFRLGRQPIGREELEAARARGAFTSTPDVVPPAIQRLVTGIAEVALSTQVARRHLVRDPTTSLLSRVVFNEALRSAAAQSSRYGWIFTVMVLRVNGPKPVPEREVRRLGYAFGRALRTGDTGGRLRGTTFAALLPNAAAEALHALVRRFCEESGVSPETIQYASASTPKDSVDPAELFRLAASRMRDG